MNMFVSVMTVIAIILVIFMICFVLYSCVNEAADFCDVCGMSKDFCQCEPGPW